MVYNCNKDVRKSNSSKGSVDRGQGGREVLHHQEVLWGQIRPEIHHDHWGRLWSQENYCSWQEISCKFLWFEWRWRLFADKELVFEGCTGIIIVILDHFARFRLGKPSNFYKLVEMGVPHEGTWSWSEEQYCDVGWQQERCQGKGSGAGRGTVLR